MVLFLRRFFLLLLMIGCISIGFANPSSKKTYQQIITTLNQQIPKMLVTHHMSGAAVVIVDTKKVVWQKGFGYQSESNRKPITSRTLFSIQSDSKMFTGIGILIAVQNGLLNLNVPIKKYLPKFTIHDCFSKDPLKRMTLKNLLSHTAGLPHEAPIGNNYNPYSPSFDAHIKSIQQTWLRYPVGQRFAYSNLGIELAGYILEKASGLSFADYMQKRVLNPIGMTSSTFDYDHIIDTSNRAIGTISGVTKVPVQIPILPSGGLYTNVIDLGRFLQFQLNNGKVNGKQILDKRYLKIMHTIPYPIYGQKFGYALGVDKIKVGNAIFYAHDGGGFGFNAEIFWSPTYNIGVAILENGYLGLKQNRLIFDVVKLLTKKSKIDVNTTESISVRYVIPISKSKLKQWCGTWAGNTIMSSGLLRLMIKDNILTKVEGDKITPLIYIGSNEFYNKKSKHIFRFIKAEKGMSKYFVRIEDGRTWDYNDGPNDKVGPNKPQWKKYIGTYKVVIYSNPKLISKIHIKNGYLYYNDYRLKEYKPGLYFSADGNTLDFRGKYPVWRNAAVLKKLGTRI